MPEPGVLGLCDETVSHSAFPGTKKDILQRYLEVCAWYHPGRNDYKRIPCNTYFCTIFAIFFSFMKSAFVVITKSIASKFLSLMIFWGNLVAQAIRNAIRAN